MRRCGFRSKENRLERFNNEYPFFADLEFGGAESRRIEKRVHIEGEAVAGGFLPNAELFRVVEFEKLVGSGSSQVDEGHVLYEV